MAVLLNLWILPTSRWSCIEKGVHEHEHEHEHDGLLPLSLPVVGAQPHPHPDPGLGAGQAGRPREVSGDTLQLGEQAC